MRWASRESLFQERQVRPDARAHGRTRPALCGNLKQALMGALPPIASKMAAWHEPRGSLRRVKPDHHPQAVEWRRKPTGACSTPVQSGSMLYPSFATSSNLSRNTGCWVRQHRDRARKVCWSDVQ